MINYDEKIKRLKDRRQGLYRKDGSINPQAQLASILGPITENFEKIHQPKSAIYAVGAMQSVGLAYTLKSYEEGDRVRDRLAEGFTSANLLVEFRYQGSVPLDVHVRGNSDIDLLLLDGFYRTVDPSLMLPPSAYFSHSQVNMETRLNTLRTEATTILRRRYPEATVDVSGSKAISISGGSLQRSVDIVPSHWHDTVDWKMHGEQHFRNVFILDAKQSTRISNKPFKHIFEIEKRCIQVSGSLRKAIRLLKNIRYDSSKKLELSSYDIASLAWHMTDAELTVPFALDLLLINNVRSFLARLVADPAATKMLDVPDRSRKIINSEAKFSQLCALFIEVNQLYLDIETELKEYANPLSSSVGRLFERPINLPA